MRSDTHLGSQLLEPKRRRLHVNLATDGNGNFDVTAAATFQTSADALTFGTGTVELADGANLTITTAGGATSIGAIRGTSAEDVTINVGASTLSVGAVGNAAEIGDIAYTATTVTLTGDQITSADQGGGSGSDTGTFSITGATVISGDVTVDTDVTTGSGTNEDGTLAFSSTIVGAGGTDNLTINSGSGAITLSGTIGVSAPLDALSINASGGAAALSIPQIGTGTAVGNAGTNGAVAIGNSASQSVTLSAAGYKFGGGATTITSGGHVITAANAKIFTDGNITLDPANASQLKTTGAFAITATTADDTINIAGDILGVDDTSNETITLQAGATNGTSGGTITIGGNIGTQIESVSLKAATAINLGGNITTVNVSNNDVTITGPAILTANVDIDVTANSSNTDEGDITFTSSINNVNGSGPFNLTLDGDGGAIAVQGVIGANDAVGVIDINQSTGDGSITLAGIGNGTTTAGNTGTVDIGNSATATLNLGGGSYFTNGATTYEAASGENINLTAATTFKTSDDALTFSTAAVDMADSANLTITTGSGAVTMTDIHGHSNETVSITSTGAVGLQEIGNADEVGVVGVAGSVITLNGDITTDADGNVTLTGPVELATGNITIDTSSASSGDGGNVSLTSTLNSKSGQTRGLTITTKAGTVSIGGVVGDLSLIHI